MVHLISAEATTLAGLLSGIRFVISQPDDLEPVDAANLRTITSPRDHLASVDDCTTSKCPTTATPA